jgi:TolB protein
VSKLRLQRWIIPVFLVFLLGCQSQEASVLNGPQTDTKKVTVMDNPEKTSYGESIVDAIVRLEDVRGMDWLNEDEIIIDRENTDFVPEKADGAQWYPHNIYVHSLLTNEQSPLHAENRNQGFAQVSPDRSKLFYKTFDLQASTGQGYLMSIPTRETVAVTDKDAMDVQNGRWVDNDSIIYASMEGMIYLTNVENHVPKKLLDTPIPFVNDVTYMNDKLYYTTLKGNLLSGPLNKKPINSDLDNVVWMVPSPDEQRLAIVQRIKSGNMELLITDLNGTVLTTIAQDAQIYGTAWSPDGTKLAYSGITPNGTVRGIYVADTSTGLSTALPVDVKFIADPLHWSPTGNRLMISSTQPNEQQKRNLFVTYLVRVGGEGE